MFATHHRQSLHNHDHHAKETTKEAFSYLLAMILNSHESHLHSGVFVEYALSFVDKRTSNNKTQTTIKSIESLDCNLKANQIHCGINRVGTESLLRSCFCCCYPTQLTMVYYQLLHYCHGVRVHNI